MRLLQPAVMLLVLGLWGCGARTVLDDYTPESSSPSPAGSGHGTGGMPPGAGDGGAGGAPEDPDPDPPRPNDVTVYANGIDVLYVLEPGLATIRSTVPLIGCDAQLLDIALDAHGSVFGITRSAVYSIQPTTGVCVPHMSEAHPNSLTFLPSDPSGHELLVGYDDGVYYRVDPMTGKSKPIGALGAAYSSSGDLAVMPSGRVYLTVKGSGCADCLAEINPTTGALIQVVGPLGQSDIYGLAAVGDVLYGFSFEGLMMRIDPRTAATEVVPLVNWDPTVSFLGAASAP